jgi:hypothetical protein
LAALLDDHGWTPPICVTCGPDHQGYPGRNWEALRARNVQILTDPATGGTFLVCRDLPQSCREGSAQRQLHLDRAAFDAFGLELPPRLCVIEGRGVTAIRHRRTCRGGRQVLARSLQATQRLRPVRSAQRQSPVKDSCAVPIPVSAPRG